MRVSDYVLRELLCDTQVSLGEKGIYLCSTAYPAESIRELAARLGVPRTTVLGLCHDLTEHGWMELRPVGSRLRPIPLVPHACQTHLARILERDFAMAANKGEFLTKCHLDLKIATDEYIDNARPDFLTSPLTDQPLEYDRFYPPSEAIDFNGLQHYIMTALHRDENELKKAQARDLMKMGMSVKAKVNLTIVRAEDLRPERFDKLLPSSLPRREFDEKGPYYQTLTRICIAYANKTEQEMAKILGSAGRYSI